MPLRASASDLSGRPPRPETGAHGGRCRTGVHGLLEHALLVVHDDRRGVQVEQALESVVTVDHATIQVVEVGRGEAAAVELDHRAQIGRNDRDDIQNHVRGAVAALQEGVNDLEALDGLLALLLLGVLVGDDGLELLGLGGEVDGSEQVADGSAPMPPLKYME